MVGPSTAGKINYLAYLFRSITFPLFNCLAETEVCSRLLYLTILKFFPGICSVSFWKKIPFALHIPQEEPEEETNGIFFFMYVSEVPLWVTQLHWSAGFGHSCKYFIHWLINLMVPEVVTDLTLALFQSSF